MDILQIKAEIIRDFFKPTFKNEGFKISGTTFRKDEKDFIKIFNIQSSAFNTKESIAFYLNIGILFPIGHLVKKEELPKSIKEYDCQFGFRTHLLTRRNQTYDLNTETNIDEFKELIKKDIKDYIVPFYNNLNSITDCLTLDNMDGVFSSCNPYIGWTLIKNGLIEEGDKIINEYIQRKGINPGWLDTVDEIRIKLKNASL